MARTDRTRQLSVEQENAIDLLVTGLSDREVAEKVGVTRQTVNGWRNGDALFAATLNARRRDLWASHVDRLRGLVTEAIDVLRDDLAGEDRRLRQTAAVHTLRAVGVYGITLTPSGPTTPETVDQAWFEDNLLGR